MSRHRRVWPRMLIGLVCLACFILPKASARAQEAETVPDQAPVFFRRTYVPAADFQRMLQGFEPMLREEFEERLASIARQVAVANSVGARLTRATYKARLQGNQLVTGEASLDVVNTSDIPAPVLLDSCEIPVRRLRWADAPSDEIIAGTGASGRQFVLVDRSGTLEFDWSLRGRRTREGQLHFTAKLPTAPLSRLIVELPAGMAPAMNKGVVSRSPPGNDARDSASASQQSWLIELGGESDLDMLVGPEHDAAANRRELIGIRQATTYQITPTGIELRARITLDANAPVPPRLEFETSSNVSLIEARMGEQDLTFARQILANRKQELVVELDRDARQASRDVYLTALARFRLGRLQSLPSLRARGVAWRQGKAELQITDALELKELIVRECLETNVEPLPAPTAGERREFQCFGPDSSIDVVVDYRKAITRISSGTSVRMNRTTMTAIALAEVSVSQGEQFIVDAVIPAPWTVDAVTATPSDALRDDPLRYIRGRRIRIPLKRPITASEPIRLTINAHRWMPANRTRLGAKDFRCVDFPTAAVQQRLVALTVDPPNSLLVAHNSNALQRSVSTLSNSELQLLGIETAGAWIYEDGPRAGVLAVELTQDRPQFSAEIAVDAIVESETLATSYRILCQPKTAPLNRMVVRFSSASERPPVWSVGGNPDAIRSARRLPSDDAGETWEVTLRQQQIEEFVLEAARTTEFRSDVVVSLASLPDASEQSGVLTVGATDATPISIDQRGLISIPAEAKERATYDVAQAVYRYDPSGDVTISLAPSIDADPTNAAWAWRCRLDSSLDPSGTGQHEALFYLENTGLWQTTLTVAPRARITEILVNNNQTPVAGVQQSISIPLPRGERFPTIRVKFETRAEPMGLLGSASVPWPELDIPCLSRTWNAWLPPGYEAVRDRRFADAMNSPTLSVDERLFGVPLFRRGVHPWSLLSNPWQHLRRQVAGDDSGTAAAAFLESITNILKGTQNRPGTPPLRWGDLLRSYLAMMEIPNAPDLPVLFVDQGALSELGITAATPLMADATESASDLLTNHGLTILVHSKTIVLTSNAVRSSYGDAVLQPLNNQVAIAGSVSDFSRIVSLGQSRQTIVPAATWKQQTTLPWTPTPSARDSAALGWTCYQLRVAPESETQLVYFKPGTVRAGQWGLFLATMGLVVWLGRSVPVRVFAFLLASSVAVLLLPIDLVPLARGVFLGSLVGLVGIVVICKQRTVESESSLPPAENSSVLVQTASATLLLLLLVSTAAVLGEETEGQPENAPKTFDVIIPVDENNEPSGEFLYVPEQLFIVLHSRSGLDTGRTQGWLLKDARYRATMFRQEDNDELYLADLVASIELETFQMSTTVEFPFEREHVRIAEATLDGLAVQSEWDAQGKMLQIVIERSGNHQLEFDLRPDMENPESQNSFSIRIPEIPSARLELSGPAVDDVELPTAVGAVIADEASGTLGVDLGPASELTVRWPRPERPEEEAPKVIVNELLWLHIKQNSVALEAVFDFSVLAGDVESVRLIADPRLRLSRFSADSPVRNYQPPNGVDRTAIVQLDEAFDHEFSIRATFVVEDMSGIGIITLPQLQSAFEERTQWFAVSLSPNLETRSVEDDSLQSKAPSDFVNAWNEPLALPQRAYETPRDLNAWQLSVRPVSTFMQVDQELDISIGRERAEVSYSADIDLAATSNRLQHRLSVPNRLRVDDVAVIQNDERRILRWDMNRATLTIFLTEPITGPHRIEIRGHLRTPLQKPADLPVVTMPIDLVRESRVRLFRQPSIWLEQVEAVGLDPAVSPQLGVHVSDMGRLASEYSKIQDWRGQEDLPRLRFVAKPNRSTASGKLHTVVGNAEGKWFAEAIVSIDVNSGAVDELQLMMPSGWTEPLQLIPNIAHEVREERSTRVLVIQPPREISTRFRVRIRGALSNPPGEPISAPLVELLDVKPLENILVLPRRAEGKAVSWETKGLIEVELPEGLNISQDEATAHQPVRPRFQAVIRDAKKVNGLPTAHLADVRVAWQADRSYYGVVDFDISPGGMRYCELICPEKLVHVSVGGLLAAPEPLGNDRWRVRLGSEALPLRINVVYSGTLSAPIRGHDTLPAPTLPGLNVDTTIWTVYGPPGAGPAEPMLAHRQATAEDLVEARSLAIEEILASTSTAGSSGNPVFERWKEKWVRRQTALRGPGRDSTTESKHEAEPAAFNVDQQVRGPAAYLSLKGSSTEIMLEYGDPGSKEIATGILCSLAFIVAGIVTVLLSRAAALREFLCRWPHAIGTILGLLWWLCLSPGFVGLAIAFIFLFGAFRPAWRIRPV